VLFWKSVDRENRRLGRAQVIVGKIAETLLQGFDLNSQSAGDN
jgi:hypothetical protein